MTDENTISESTIEKVNKEIDKLENAKLEERVQSLSKQYEEAMKKQMEEASKRFDEELKKRDAQISTMKADFEKQVDSISLRKSIPASDVVAQQPQVPKAYKDLSKEEKDAIDRQFFINKGVPL